LKNSIYRILWHFSKVNIVEGERIYIEYFFTKNFEVITTKMNGLRLVSFEKQCVSEV